MALQLDHNNLPYYGEGFQGLARKVFANIYDPKNLLPAPTQQQKVILDKSQSHGEQFNQNTGWDKWVGSWTGIKSSDAVQAAVAASLAVHGTDAQGNINKDAQAGNVVAATTGLIGRTVGQEVSVGLSGLSLISIASRKVQAFNTAIADIGNSSTILPDVTSSEKTAVSLLGDTPTAHKLGGLIDSLNDTLVLGPYNVLRAITSGESMAQEWKTVVNYQKGSDMIYTMYFDEVKKAEYLRRVQGGENADLLVTELSNPWVELAGSILGDPSTYLGVGIVGDFGKASSPVRMFGKTLFEVPWRSVGRIPGFGELLGLSHVGISGLSAAADEFGKVDTAIEAKAFNALNGVSTEHTAVQALTDAFTATRDATIKFATEYGILSPTSEGKAAIMKQSVGTFMSALAAKFTNVDEMMGTFKAFQDIKSPDPVVAAQAFSTMKSTLGVLPFSHGGKQAMEFINKLVAAVDIPALYAKHTGTMGEFAGVLMGKLDGVISDMYPSINDMEEAWKAGKVAGAKLEPRAQFLADTYEKLKASNPVALWANKANNAVAGNKLYQGLQSFFAGVYMGMRPAYAMRNLQQNSLTIWHDMGLQAGVASLVEGTAAALKKDWATAVIDAHAENVKKMLGGILPPGFAKGIGSAGVEGKGIFNFALQAGQRTEQAHSALIMDLAIQRHLQDAVRYGGTPAIDNMVKAGLSQSAAERLLVHAAANFGDETATLKAWRLEQATGHAEVWRTLELDPTFKSALQTHGLLGELDNIRQTATDGVDFQNKMDGFLKKAEELASRTAGEPALVGQDNIMAPVVATVERAFDAGGRKAMSEQELNRFRALTETRYQLQQQFRSVSQALRGQLTRLLPNADAAKPFDEAFNASYKVVDDGVASLRNFAIGTHDGIYAQSLKGVPPSELWAQARTMVPEIRDGQMVLKPVTMAESFPNVDPAKLNNSDFNGMLWKWVKDTQESGWKAVNEGSLTHQGNILEQMAAAAGTTVDDVKIAYYGSLKNPELTRIDELTKSVSDWEKYADFSTVDMKGKTLADMFGSQDPALKAEWTALQAKINNAEEWAKMSKMEQMTTKTRIGQLDELLTPSKGTPSLGLEGTFNAVNADRASRGLQPYPTVANVPMSEASQVLKKLAPHPPYVEGTQPTVARQLAENLKGGLRDALDQFTSGTLQRWGEKVPIDSNLTPDMEKAISEWGAELGKRTATQRAGAMAVAEATRNFILHDYNKTYGDKAAGYLLMYHYWTSRTYVRWLERVVDTPGVPAAYAKLRDTLTRVHSDQPDFYRYNLPVGKLPGLNNDPMFFNLEATLNPVYGLTGVDFNDPSKRVDWISSAVDDMGKFGFNLAVPLQWAMAYNLYQKGQEDAARRWAGRLIPATADYKAAIGLIQQKTGVDITPQIGQGPLHGLSYGELDPIVNVFSGGVDPYEEARVGRAMAGMIMDKTVTREAGYDAMYSKNGPLYDEAVQRAVNERAPGQMASFFLGVGYKTRTPGDVQVDQFYAQYTKLLSLRDTTSPDDYRAQFDQLMNDNPFADSVLLAKRGGDSRDAAYAYNVVGRLPPGEVYKLLPAVGIDQSMLNRFYQDKGDFSKWLPSDKNKFMSAILDMGATFSIPDGATKQEWDAARAMSAKVDAEVAKVYGADTQNVVSAYFDLVDTNKDKAAEFKMMHPEIDGSLQMRREMIVSNPYLYKYYGSIDTITGYFDGKVRAYLADKYGQDIGDKSAAYFDYAPGAERKQYLYQHPELQKYWTEKRTLDAQSSQAMIDFGKTLQENAPAAVRPDAALANKSQNDLTGVNQQQQEPTWDEVVSKYKISPWLQQQIISNVQNGTPLTKAGSTEITYIENKYNIYHLLERAGIALSRQSGGLNPLP
jgi:hypothetical protein